MPALFVYSRATLLVLRVSCVPARRTPLPAHREVDAMPSKCEGPYHCPGCPTCAVTRRPLTPSDEARIARALRNDPPVHGTRPLRLVQTTHETTSYTAPAACDGTMTCSCERCQQHRALLIQFGHKKVRQPWEQEAA